MESLGIFQRSFAEALTNPERSTPECIGGGEQSERDKRFNVYRNNRTMSLINALADTFPGVKRYVGEAFFVAAARVFVQNHPPHRASLSVYGGEFPAFLGQFPPAQSTPCVGDLAKLEWLKVMAFHAADETPLSIDIMAGLDSESVSSSVLTFHPSAGLLRSRWPVASLLDEMIRVDQPRGELSMGVAEDVLVIRNDSVESRILPAGSAVFTGSLMAGQSLQQSAQCALDDDPEFDLAFHLGGLFTSGAVIAVNPANTNNRGDSQ